MSIYSKILIVILWSVSILCCSIMKKIQPEAIKLYMTYAIIISVSFTMIVSIFESCK